MNGSATPEHRAGAPDVTCLVWVARPVDASADLTDGERHRWSSLVQAPDRDRFSTGVRLQRRALWEVTGEHLTLRRRCATCGSNDHGPVSAPPPFDAEWTMSLSHSGERVVLAMAPARTAVGVDVERIRPRSGAVARTVLTARELAADALPGNGAGASQAGDGAAFTTRWVRKEAVLKATRQGLTVPMTDLEVTGLGSPPALTSWASSSRPADLAPGGVQLVELAAGDGYAACLAVLTTTAVRVRYRGGGEGSALQVGKNGEYPPVGVLGRREVELGEDAVDVLGDGLLGHHEASGNR